MCGWSYQGKPVAVNSWLELLWLELLWLPAGMHEGAGYVPLNWLLGSRNASRVRLASFFSPKLQPEHKASCIAGQILHPAPD